MTQDRNKESFVVRFCEYLSTIDGIRIKRAKGYLHIVFNAEASALGVEKLQGLLSIFMDDIPRTCILFQVRSRLQNILGRSPLCRQCCVNSGIVFADCLYTSLVVFFKPRIIEMAVPRVLLE